MCVILLHCEVRSFLQYQIIHILIQNISRSSTSSVLLDRRITVATPTTLRVYYHYFAAMGSLEVIYVKQYELPNTPEHVMKYELCEICEHIVPDQVIAAQLFKGVWSIWLRTSEAKDHLMSLQSLTVKHHKAEIHGVYPTSKSFPDEKIIFRDLPISASDDYILDYLDAQPGIK